MENSITIRPLEPHHAPTISKIHLTSQEGTFLTSLGLDFLTLLYNQISQSDHSISYAALNKKNEVVGFIAGTSNTGTLFKDIISKNAFHLGWLVFKQALKNPALLWQTMKTLAYPNQMSGDTPEAELLALAVHPDWRNQKIGSCLLQTLIQNMHAVQITKMVVTVDARNNGALRFYRRQGFVQWADTEMYNRPMVHLVTSTDSDVIFNKTND